MDNEKYKREVKTILLNKAKKLHKDFDIDKWTFQIVEWSDGSFEMSLFTNEIEKFLIGSSYTGKYSRTHTTKYEKPKIS